MNTRTIFPHTLIRAILLVLSTCVSVGVLYAQEDDSHFYKDTSYYTLTPVPVNTHFADWGAMYHGGNLYFSSNRPAPRPGSLIHHTDEQTQEKYYTLYSSKVDSTKNYGEVEKFAKELDRKYNVGPIYITPDGKTMVVTYNIDKKKLTYKNRAKKNRNYVLELYFYTYNEHDKKWGQSVAFPYNSNKYNCAHAFMSSDGQRLFFSSDMSGTLGSMDIFVCSKEGNSWGVPRNLGSMVNSENNDIFPSLSEDGQILYFSSDRPGGMGGLDIYQIELPLTTKSSVENLGYPVNTTFDDFGLVYYNENGDGYLSSNRPLNLDNGKTMDESDNIYHLRSSLLACHGYTLTLVDSLTGQPISADMSYICHSCLGSSSFTKSMGKGEILKNVRMYTEKPYTITLNKDDFGTAIVEVIPTEKTSDIVVKMPLRSRLVGVVVNTKGVPVPGVDVKVANSDGTFKYYKTNLQGQFTSTPFLGGHTLTTTAAHRALVAGPEIVVVPSNPDELLPEYAVSLELELPKRLVISAAVLFDFDKYTITARAKDTLDMVVSALKDQPDVTVVLEGYTDTRGTAAYNEVLSLRRAKAVETYLVQHGISVKRLKSEGYGFSRLVNHCTKNVKCTEEEHQENRRVEFIFSKEVEKKSVSSE